MLLTPHTLVGLTLGATIANPAVAVPLSFFMHFMGDLVPHWDFYSNTEFEERRVGWRPFAVLVDLVVAVAIGLTVTYYALWVVKSTDLALNIFLCGIAAVLPDAMEAPHLFLDKNWKPFMLVGRLQGKLQFQAPLPWGILTQIFVMGVSLFILYYTLI